MMSIYLLTYDTILQHQKDQDFIPLIMLWENLQDLYVYIWWNAADKSCKLLLTR